MNRPPLLFGASVYPEIIPREDWLALLDLCERCRFTCVRLGEAAWGNLERFWCKLRLGVCWTDWG